MIVSCAKMQTTSWDEEIKLLDGALYEIDLDQDFSSICLIGQPITDMPVGSIIETIELLDSYESEKKTGRVDTYTSSSEGSLRGRELFEYADKVIKEERKQEKKWKEDKPNREKRNKQFLEDIESGLYFLDFKKVNSKRVKKLRRKANGRGK